MSDKLSVGSEKGMASLAPENRSHSGSREQSPSALAAGSNLDHSMESLLASASSEEGIFHHEEISPEIVSAEEISNVGGKVGKVSDDADSVSSFHSAVESQLEERRSERFTEGKRMMSEDKKRKKRISHRERKISVSGKAAAAKVSKASYAAVSPEKKRATARASA